MSRLRESFFKWLLRFLKVREDEESYSEEFSIARKRRRLLLFGILIIFVLALTFQFIFQGQRSQIPIASNLAVLFLLNINIILLLVTVVVVVRNLIKLYMQREGKSFVRRFQTKLVLAFVALTLVPSALLFVVASGLINSSVNNWFSETVENSLRDSLEVAETLYSHSEKSVMGKATGLASIIKQQGMMSDENDVYLNNTVQKYLHEFEVDEIAVYDSKMQRIERAIMPGRQLEEVPDFTSRSLKDLFSSGGVTRVVEGEGRSLVLTLVPIGTKGGKPSGALFIADSIDRSVVEKVNAITKTFDEYKQLKLQQNPIKAIYEVTFLLITLIIIFAAIWYGFHLAREITVPIYDLAEAMEKVTAGDLTVRLDEKSNDEIGVLISSFNRMTEELDVSNKKIDVYHKEQTEVTLELDRRARYIETILAKIATGVISIDNRGKVTTFNSAAMDILKWDGDAPVGSYYEDVFGPMHLEPLRSLLREMGENEKEFIERELNFVLDEAKVTLIVHVTSLRGADGRFMGLAVVFDDITTLINAQKTSAWRDIAQHMAHEIKNPLTPIQLNAERLKRQYRQGPEAFEKIFDKSTDLIIKEVDVIRTLIDEFRKFAQLPEPQLERASLHNVIKEVVDAYHDSNPNILLSTEFDHSVREMMLDREQMHRVFINLVQNAIDAIKSADEGGDKNQDIRITTKRRGDKVTIEVLDSGSGISEKDMDSVLLPYFSTKAKGSGLGLAIVNRIIADHEGKVRVKNRVPHGAIISIELPA